MAFGNLDDGSQDAPMADINVTPLVDVMLVLLIVFMITMPVLTHSLSLNLPVADAAAKQQPKSDVKPFDIAVNSSGQYSVGAESSQIVDLDAVKVRLKAIAAQDPETVVAISADSQAAYEHVAKVLEAAQEAGLRKVGFRMEVKQQAK